MLENRMYGKGDWERPVRLDDSQRADWRKPFMRDYGRIVHSASFRRQQGKTQVFPGHESDFFRNRLTHSIEVAQIAEGIADRLNHVYQDQLTGMTVDGRLCAAAGLVHDIGHPPFGHNGERALDAKMKAFGGFEGNAQTLRILSRLEKKVKFKEPLGGDDRAGMNLCFRTLAAVLKYDKEIPQTRADTDKLVKGYYASEAPIVELVKKAVLRTDSISTGSPFKTIECAIMDLADDIAYSVYDLEDSLKVGILSPAGILSSEDPLLDNVAKEVTKQTGTSCNRADVLSIFVDVFRGIIAEGSEDPILAFIESVRSSNELGADSYLRTRLSSQLVHEFINGVELELNEQHPALSQVRFATDTLMKVETIKQYTYLATIYSARVKLGEYRGTEIVTDIFDALAGDRGFLLMPDDVRQRYLSTTDTMTRARTICDFVAGMTDRYAMEFWARLRSDVAESMFKPI